MINATALRARRASWPLVWVAVLGLASAAPYLYLVQLGNLREHPAAYGLGALVALALFVPAVLLAVRMPGRLSNAWLVMIFGVAILLRAELVFSQPRLSDDMYRYMWDGRVQAQGINPYTYPPNAPELAGLRDADIWPLINRPSSVTVYPGGTQLAFAALWRIWPDNVHWFQAAMSGGGLLAGLLLLLVLRALGLPDALVLAFLWNPALIIETTHSAHVDGLVLPLIVATWLACARGRKGWTGIALGMATAMKLYPAMLAPALWPADPESGSPTRHLLSGRLRLLLGMVVVPILAYLPYLRLGSGVFAFFPTYLDERVPSPLTAALADAITRAGFEPRLVFNGVLAAGLLACSVALVLRPATSPEHAIRRCMWPIAVFSVLSKNVLPWYMLWALPLTVLFLRPGRWGLKADVWTFFFAISTLVCLVYALGGLV